MSMSACRDALNVVVRDKAEAGGCHTLGGLLFWGQMVQEAVPCNPVESRSVEPPLHVG